MEEQLKEEMIKNSENKIIPSETKLQKMEEKRNKIQSLVDKYKINLKHQVQQIKDVEEQINCTDENIDEKTKKIIDFNTHLQQVHRKNNDDISEVTNLITNIYLDRMFKSDGRVLEDIENAKLQLQKQQLKNQQCEIRTNAMKKKLEEDLKSIESPQKVYEKQMVRLTTLEKEYQRVNGEYLKATEGLSNHNNLRSCKDDLLKKIRELSSSIRSFELNNSNLFFRYIDPRPNFDRSKVHGLVCRLFKPIDFKFELALTTLAGSKLYFIVVEDDTVCKDILETNNFPNCTNFIPLHVINSNSLTPNVIRIAQQIGGVNQVFPAMSLIKYDEKYFKVMQWVFGRSFVCTTKEIAKKVCFDNRVKKHCFTLEGDHFNPSSDLAGGASNQRLVLKAIAHQDEIKLQLHGKQSELAQIENTLATMKFSPVSPDKIKQLRNRQLAVQVEIEKINLNVHLRQPDQQVTKVNSIKNEIAELENKLDKGKSTEEQLKSDILYLKQKMKNAKKNFDEKIYEANQILRNIHDNIHNSRVEESKVRNYYTALQSQLKDLLSLREDEENRLAMAKEKKSKLEEQLILTMTKFDNIDNIYKKAYNNFIDKKKKKTNENEKINNAHRHKTKIVDEN